MLNRRSAGLLACIAAPLLASGAAHAATVRPTVMWTEDVTREFYNSELNLTWPVRMGTWIDADRKSQGPKAFATGVLKPTAGPAQVVEIDVTAYVKQYGADFFIRPNGGSNSYIHSRESDVAEARPQLVVTKAGRITTLAAEADATLNNTTSKTLGKAVTLQTGSGFLMRFPQPADAGITKAVLRLTTSIQPKREQQLGVYRPDPRPAPLSPIATPIGSMADVVLHLKGDAWKTGSNFRHDRMVVNADGSLTVTVPTGTSLASDTLYSIRRGDRHETMFSRIVMKPHTDWAAPNTGGKYPGLSNTGMKDKRATQCGWGSRTANGVCWSARTNRWGQSAGSSFMNSHQGLSPYVYRYNRSTFWGEGPSFTTPLELGKYLVLDQMVKLNSIATDGTPNNDGEVAYWINGVLVGRMTNIVFRTRTGDDTLPSEYWLDFYVGGTGYKAPYPHRTTVHEVLVSTKRLPFDRAKLDSLNQSSN